MDRPVVEVNRRILSKHSHTLPMLLTVTHARIEDVYLHSWQSNFPTVSTETINITINIIYIYILKVAHISHLQIGFFQCGNVYKFKLITFLSWNVNHELTHRHTYIYIYIYIYIYSIGLFVIPVLWEANGHHKSEVTTVRSRRCRPALTTLLADSSRLDDSWGLSLTGQ